MRNIFILLFGSLSMLNAQSTPIGDWQGAIEIGLTKLNINVHFKNSRQATIDIPQQGAVALSLKNIRITTDSVYFELPAGPGVAIFDGAQSMGEIRGTFTQGVAVGSFYLKPSITKTAEISTLFDSKEVIIPNGDIQLAGTLLTPKNRSTYPGVILVTGSGPQNRDEEIFGFKIFKVIAESLATKGIAVLRYNDRGFPPSSGDFKTATTADFATDAQAAVHYLRKVRGMQISRIGILGHSEGAVIASMLAGQHKDLDFIVLMAGPAIRGDSLLLAQSSALLNASHSSKEKIAREQHIQNEIFKTIRNDDGWDTLQEHITQIIDDEVNTLPQKTKAAIPDIKSFVEAKTSAQMASVRSPWMKWFINYNPAIDMRNIHIPVLALFGGKDLQVPAAINLKEMQKIFKQNGNTKFLPFIFVDANHLFQDAKNGTVQEYPILKKTFTNGFLTRISDWILTLPAH